MRKCICILGCSIGLILATSIEEVCRASGIPLPYDIEFEPLTALTTDGPVTMGLTLRPRSDRGDTISIEMGGDQGLKVTGSTTRTVTADSSGSFVANFQVVIPKGDTSCLTIQVHPGGLLARLKYWFVTTGDTVEFWKGDPREFNSPDRRDPPPGRRGRIIPGEFPDLDSAYGIPPEMIHPDYREQDSTPARIYEPLPTKAEMDSAILEKQRRHLHELEQTPLTEYGRQLVKVGDTIWIRNYGETKFRVAEKKRYLDSSVNGEIETKARPVRPTNRFDAMLEPLEDLRPDKRLRFRLTVVPNYECGSELELTVITKDGLVYAGPANWKATAEKGSAYTTELSIAIPNNDTSTLHILLHCGELADRIDRHFVTTADTVEFWMADPRTVHVPPRRLLPFGPKEDSTSGQAPPDSASGIQPFFGVTTYSTPKEETQAAEMRTLEEEPLTGAQVQYHSVGKELYRRLEGEREFTLVRRRTVAEVEADKRNYLDSIADLAPDAEIPVCLNLSQDEHRKVVLDLVGSLGQEEPGSYFHHLLTKEQLQEVVKQGIPFLYLDLEDIVHRRE